MNKNNIIEYYDSKLKKMALLIKAEYSGSGIEFLTSNDDFMQVAYMEHSAGHVIVPHLHNRIERIIDYTCETLIMRKGVLSVTLYEDEKQRHSFEIKDGDILVLYSGGHGFKAIDDIEMVEIKQGPYVGANDKTRF